MRPLPLLSLLLLVCLSGCFATQIGQPNVSEYQKYNWDKEHPRVVRVHVYLDDGVSEDRARKLLGKWKDDDAKWYGIELRPIGFDLLPREAGLLHNALLDQIDAVPLKGDEDRIFYFANPRLRDYLYSYIGLPLGFIPPEVLGEVDDPTMTHGWAWAHMESLPSIFSMTPEYTTWHEFYHLIGSCPHGHDMGAPNGCYEHIQVLRTTPTKAGFFASMSADGNHLYRSRAEVNARLLGWHDPLWPFGTTHEEDNRSHVPLPPAEAQQQAHDPSALKTTEVTLR